jgi:glutamate synthase (NADPH/NADH) large chain
MTKPANDFATPNVKLSVDRSKPGYPDAQGLYNPANERDACGIGFVVNIKGVKTHKIVRQGLEILVNLTHRGAVGADPKAGDGSGLLIQMPDAFIRDVTKDLGIDLPDYGSYGVGMVFLPQDDADRARAEAEIESMTTDEGQSFLGWRDVPTDNGNFSDGIKQTEPVIRQFFVGRSDDLTDQDAFERKLYVIRKRVSFAITAWKDNVDDWYYVPSFSSRVILYKGILLANQVGPYYPDLYDERVVSALALVHQRFSTNTFPTWKLAQPFRYICHNGEINTVRGNINWMNARRHTMESELFGDDLKKIWPLIPEGQSDSACFDNALELLLHGGYSLSHAMMMLIPEAWSGNPLMDDGRRAFYEYHAAVMEPWDGPAAVAFTDGIQIGATLDRNGLRPARYYVTKDDMVILSSEAGVLTVPEENIVKKWRLQPGKMLLIDTKQGRIIDDDEIKAELSDAQPYQDKLDAGQILLRDVPESTNGSQFPDTGLSHLKRQQAFGYTQEDLKILLTPMITSGQEPTGSMGTDTPVAVLSEKPKLLFNYFKQRFAQVTNPPIDPIREELVMSLTSFIGPRPNLLGLKIDGHKRLEVTQPVLINSDLEKIRDMEKRNGDSFSSVTLDITFAASEGEDGMLPALDALCAAAEQSVVDGYNIIILSDRQTAEGQIPIPSLLATSAVHHHLIQTGLRTSAGLVVETGEAREVHHFCMLGGYGAEAINPYVAFDTIAALAPKLDEPISVEEATDRYIKALNKGMLKVMSKMGISTFHSYCGAQIFDAVGLSSDVVDTYFFGTATTIEGADIEAIATEAVRRHGLAFSDAPIYRKQLDAGGDYHYRIRGEEHIWSPETIGTLQHAVRGNNPDKYREFAAQINEQSEKLLTPRGLFEIAKTNQSIPLDDVEPATEIVKRFATGAMSFGSISREAHTTLAIAMNRIGGKSNTGEGGEEVDRFTPLANGDSMRSAIKQVASGRFGVTVEYLVNSDDIQIKMAQGAKPGEGGQLPGHKVDQTIASVRHSTPGVGLISPPPHHDIYSIEDLAQLIYDLKNVNPRARISVKLVSEVGVGTVAAGVSKARADHVTIAGFDGGTGASPLTSIKHAGSPWEIGLAETHQTLLMNSLRGRIAVQVDGGLRTGRDVVIGALLGADEFGFATAPLIAAGCIMMRKCHLNTCPVGIATQDPDLRKRFTGEPEHVINYFFFVAEEVREYMAEMGFRTVNEMIGRSDMLDTRKAIDHWKADGLDFTKLFFKPEMGPDVAVYNSETQNHDIFDIMDRTLIEKSQDAINHGVPVQIQLPVANTDRTIGAMLSGEIAVKHGLKGLPQDTIHVKLTGTAGQSFGAFAANGVSLELIGEANDYVGKGISGGRLVIYPHPDSPVVPTESMIVGNTVLYGAVSGECYFRGMAGERFAVRNSGATAVVEGVGDHGCEYMTGGVVAVIGTTGRNFAAGMSGGIAYVLDEEGDFERRCNLSMVELEPIPAEDRAGQQLSHQGGELEGHGMVDVKTDMSRYDAERLKVMLRRHAKYTDSDRARDILDNWDEYLPKFVKVMPVDYRRALEETHALQEADAKQTEWVGA